LNNKFSQAIAVLTTMKPPPTFLSTRSYLLQEEMRIKHSLQMEAQTALIAVATTASSIGGPKAASTPTAPSPQPATPSGGGGDRRKKRKADNRNRQGAPPASSSTTANAPPLPQWTS
jgi:hypothetical protein